MIGVLLAAAVIAGAAWAVLGRNTEPEAYVTITVNKEQLGRYSLSEDRVIPIGDSNRCRIEGGRVRMEWADCPDQICVHHVPLDQAGGVIVCLPNQVLVEVTGGEEGGEAPDTITS